MSKGGVAPGISVMLIEGTLNKRWDGGRNSFRLQGVMY
jgi:hypothetical protein